jgi:hypothetical protein
MTYTDAQGKSAIAQVGSIYQQFAPGVQRIHDYYMANSAGVPANVMQAVYDQGYLYQNFAPKVQTVVDWAFKVPNPYTLAQARAAVDDVSTIYQKFAPGVQTIHDYMSTHSTGIPSDVMSAMWDQGTLYQNFAPQFQIMHDWIYQPSSAPYTIVKTITDRAGRTIKQTNTGKLEIDGVLASWSSNVTDIFLVNGVAWQAAGGRYYLCIQGDPGINTDPRNTQNPNGQPAEPAGVVIPADMLTFAGMSMIPDRWDQDLNPSSWQSGDSTVSYRTDKPFISPSGYLGMPYDADTALNKGASEVQWNESFKRRKGYFETYVQVNYVPGICNAACWIYGNLAPAAGGFVPGATSSEVDQEVNTVDGGSGLRVHHINQPWPAGESYHDVLTTANWNVPHRFGIKWDLNAGYIEWYLDGVMRRRVTPANCASGAFPDEDMKPWVSARPTGWYDGNGTLRDGWCGYWNGQAGIMWVYGWKFTEVA